MLMSQFKMPSFHTPYRLDVFDRKGGLSVYGKD